MSCNTDEEVRVILKYSTIAGTEPTIPASGDHEDGTWLPTDLYVGELFMNSVDEKLWIRTDNGIVGIGGTAGATFSGIYDYVHISGGTYSGEVYAPTFSSIGIVAQNIYGDIFQGNAGASASFIGSFFGDGSGLTGLICEWLGGTVSAPVHFTDRVDFTNDIYIDGAIYSNNPNIAINSSLEITGGVSASIFYGDGSGLTNLPTGTYSDTYTSTAALTGNTILFTRNDASDYSVDLTPILATQGVAMIQWDDTTDVLTLYMNDSTQLGITIDTFSQVSSTGPITAPEFYGGTFYGSFVGDMEGVVGATGPAGATGAAGPTGPAGPAGANLNQVLIAGNQTSGEDIVITAQDRIYFSANDYITTLPDDTGMLMRSSHNIDNVGSIRVEDWLLDLYTTSATETASITVEPSGLTVNTSNGTGLKYMDDYSATLVERSLVDKGYVDGILNNMTLENVLKSGNTTGTQSIYISSSASVIEGYNGVRHHWYDASNPILGDYYRIENGTGSSSSYIQIEDNTRGNIRIANDNLFSTSSDYSERTSVIVGQSDIQHNSTTRDYVGGTVWSSTNQTIYMNGSDMVTRDYILDTTGWVATSTTGVYLQGARNGGLSASEITITPDTITSRTENDGHSWTQIEQRSNAITISGDSEFFRGLEYDNDYSSDYTDYSLVNKKYIIDTFGTTDITYAALEAAAYAGSLTKGTTYFITDRKIWIKALDTNLLSTSAQRSQQIIKDEAYQMTGTLGVWNSDLAPSIGDKVIWGGRLWSNTTGAVGSSDNYFTLNATDWTLITSDALYYDKIFDIEYDIKYDYINRQSDNRNNIILNNQLQGENNTIDYSDWGNLGIYNNTTKGIYNNRVSYIHNNNLETKDGRISNNSGGDIVNNTNNGGIEDNNTIGRIEFNNNNGDIRNNTGAIKNNCNNGGIANNTCDVQNNLNEGEISNNTNNGSIYKNSNNGYISGNTSTNMSIIQNTNNGDIEGNTNNGDITQNSNNGHIINNSIDSQIFLNSNDGYISNNSGNDYIYFNSNTGAIFDNNGGAVETNSNNGSIYSNSGTVQSNSNNGSIFSNLCSISMNTNNGTIYGNTINGSIERNTNNGNIESNTQTSGTTNIIYNNNNGAIGGARTGDVIGTIVNI